MVGKFEEGRLVAGSIEDMLVDKSRGMFKFVGTVGPGNRSTGDKTVVF